MSSVKSWFTDSFDIVWVKFYARLASVAVDHEGIVSQRRDISSINTAFDVMAVILFSDVNNVGHNVKSTCSES